MNLTIIKIRLILRLDAVIYFKKTTFNFSPTLHHCDVKWDTLYENYSSKKRIIKKNTFIFVVDGKG